MFSRSSSFYELLEVPVDANRDTVLDAWQDKRRAAVAMTPVLGSDEVEALCARLDEAFQTLSHPLRGKRYRRYHLFSEASDQPGTAEVADPVTRSWVQLSLPLLHEEQSGGPSVTAYDELRSSSPKIAALDVRAAGVLGSELLDTLELLEEAVTGEPGVPGIRFKVV